MAKSTTEIERDIRRALDGVPFEVRGLWHEMRHLIETESDRPGHLRLNGRPLTGEKLAFKAGSSPIVVARLLPDLEEVGLIELVERCYFSRQLARIAEVRAGGARRKRDCVERVLRNTHGNAQVTPMVTPEPPPPPDGSPLQPLSLTPSTPVSFSSKTTGGASPPPVSTENQPKSRQRKPTGERKLTDEQLGIQRKLQDWWINHGWPAAHAGAIYEFDGSDAAAVLKILRSKEISWNLERAKALLAVFLHQPDLYGAAGHQLRIVGQKFNYYITELKKSEKGMNTHVSSNNRRSPVARGEYESSLPVESRKLGGGSTQPQRTAS